MEGLEDFPNEKVQKLCWNFRLACYKIEHGSSYILLSNSVNEELKRCEIMNKLSNLFSPIVIEPARLSTPRKRERRYFESYIDAEHRYFIINNYYFVIYL